MNELEEQIIITFENIRILYLESASILNDIESLLVEKNYICTHGNTVGTEQSKNINNPQKWITPYVSRYFSNNNDPFKKYAIGIFFVDKSYNPINPIVLFGSFNMLKDDDGEPSVFSYWYLKEAWFTLAAGNEMNTIYEFSDCWNARSGKVSARELISITGQNEINKIVEDLLKI